MLLVKTLKPMFTGPFQPQYNIVLKPRLLGMLFLAGIAMAKCAVCYY